MCLLASDALFGQLVLQAPRFFEISSEIKFVFVRPVQLRMTECTNCMSVATCIWFQFDHQHRYTKRDEYLGDWVAEVMGM